MPLYLYDYERCSERVTEKHRSWDCRSRVQMMTKDIVRVSSVLSQSEQWSPPVTWWCHCSDTFNQHTLSLTWFTPCSSSSTLPCSSCSHQVLGDHFINFQHNHNSTEDTSVAEEDVPRVVIIVTNHWTPQEMNHVTSGQDTRQHAAPEIVNNVIERVNQDLTSAVNEHKALNNQSTML